MALMITATVLADEPAQSPGPVPEASRSVSPEPQPLRIGIAGMVHGHVEGLLWQATRRTDLQIVGVFEPNREAFDRLASKYGLDP
ncbi:MAG: hypothetical protein ACKON8_01860, partial [Planctomycetota bacterium]